MEATTLKNQKPQVNSTSTGQRVFPEKQHTPPGILEHKHFSFHGRTALAAGRCPYCDTDEVEGMLFSHEEHRMGGFLDCRFCGVSIAWLNNPFEASQAEYEPGE